MKTYISTTLSIITLPYPIPSLVKEENKYPNMLYERNSFTILIDSMGPKNVILGSPNIGKSMIPYYYLIRLKNMSKPVFGSLPITNKVSDERPKVVIIRNSNDLTLYFIDEMKAYTCTSPHNSDLIDCFKPESIICFITIDNDTTASACRSLVLDLSCKMYTYVVTIPHSVSPPSNTYTSTNKTTGYTNVMTLPLWPLKDLKSLYEYHKPSHPITDGHNSDLSSSDDIITQRYYIYGGILKCIRPSTTTDEIAYTSKIDEKITSIDIPRIWDLSTKYYTHLRPVTGRYLFYLDIKRVMCNGQRLHKRLIAPASNYVRKMIYESYLTKYNNDNDLIYSIQMLIKYQTFWHISTFNTLFQLYISRQIAAVGGTKRWRIRANYMSDLQVYSYIIIHTL